MQIDDLNKMSDDLKDLAESANLAASNMYGLFYALEQMYGRHYFPIIQEISARFDDDATWN